MESRQQMFRSMATARQTMEFISKGSAKAGFC
jgi:hypothetical protein